MKVTCPACCGDVGVNADGRIDYHKEQILGAHGFVDGYVNCAAGGRPARLPKQAAPALPRAGE